MNKEHSEKILNTFCEDLESYVEGTLPDTRRLEMLELLNSSDQTRNLLAEFEQANQLFEEVDWPIDNPKNLPTAQEILFAAGRGNKNKNWKILNFFSWQPLPTFSWVLTISILFGVTWYLVKPNLKENNLNQESKSVAVNKPDSPSSSSEMHSTGEIKPDNFTKDNLKSKESNSSTKSIEVEEEKKSKEKEGILSAPPPLQPPALPASEKNIERTPSAKPPEMELGKKQTREQDQPPKPDSTSKEDHDEIRNMPGGSSIPDNKAIAPEKLSPKDRSKTEEIEVSKETRHMTKPSSPKALNGGRGEGYGSTASSSQNVYRSTTITLNIVVKDLDKLQSQFTSITKQNHGEFTSVNTNKTGLSLAGVVPSNQLSNYLSKLRGLGHIEKEHSNGKDIQSIQNDSKQRVTIILNARLK